MFALIIQGNTGTIMECQPNSSPIIFNSSESRLFTVQFFPSQREAFTYFRKNHNGELEIRLDKEFRMASRIPKSA